METPALTIWPERMEEEIPADEVTRKDFFVTSGNGPSHQGTGLFVKFKSPGAYGILWGLS